jgi:hypothetical protein
VSRAVTERFDELANTTVDVRDPAELGPTVTRTDDYLDLTIVDYRDHSHSLDPLLA